MCQYFTTNSILKELYKIKTVEFNKGVRVPLPKILYIQRYGRKVQEEIQEILSEICRKDWFLFKTGGRLRDEGLLESLKTELEKHASTGREFEGCILIELSKETLIKDGFIEFIEYLKECEKKLYYIFIMKSSKDAVSIQKSIEQYFFVRTIYAENFSVEEQFDIIKATCEEYGFGISVKAENFLLSGLKNNEWRIDDNVACRLQNEICTIIYEAIIDGKAKERLISLEMSKKLLKNLQNGITPEITFGFSQRELEVS